MFFYPREYGTGFSITHLLFYFFELKIKYLPGMTTAYLWSWYLYCDKTEISKTINKHGKYPVFLKFNMN